MSISSNNKDKINSLNYYNYPDIMVVYNVVSTPKGKKTVYSADKLFINLSVIYEISGTLYDLTFNIKSKEKVKDNNLIQNLVDIINMR